MQLTEEELERIFTARSRKKLAHLGGVFGIEQSVSSLREKGEAQGRNDLSSRSTPNIVRILTDQMRDKTLQYLFFATLLSLASRVYHWFKTGEHSYFEGTNIILAIVLILCINTGSEYKKEKTARDLEKKTSDISVKVVTNGKKQMKMAKDLRIGDRVALEPGDIIPADMILISGTGLSCDESVITGESDYLDKTDTDPFLISGTHVASGVGTGLVICVGVRSARGRLKKTADAVEKKEMPLQKKLEALVTRLAKYGVAVSAAVFIVSSFRAYLKGKPSEIIPQLMKAISLAAIAIPEGLPMAISVSMIFAALKMYGNNALIRDVRKCETMNSVTVLCIDKTGTITKNAMIVKEALINGKISSPHLENSLAKEEALLGILTNTTAFQSAGKMHGQKTEVALLEMLILNGAKKIPERPQMMRTHPFSSEKKYMSTHIPKEEIEGLKRKHPDIFPKILADTDLVMFKGAPEVILKYCTHVSQDNGITAINGSLLNTISCIDEKHRRVAMAYRKGNALEIEQNSDLVFVALFGIEDELREGVGDCVKTCKAAGISVKIVTGDSEGIARSIAEQIGLTSPQDIYMGGSDFRSLSEKDVLQRLKNLKILYRATPEDKLALVNLLRKNKEVVAVTGDGSNDAPALKHSDIGYAMGSGTDASKAACDVILLKNDFGSLVKSIFLGRCVSDNIRKFCQLQLTLSLTAVTLCIFDGGLDMNPLLLSSERLLWLNTIGDTVASICMAMNSPSEQTVKRPPERKSSDILTPGIYRYIITNYMYQMLSICILSSCGYSSSFLFNFYVCVQLVSVITANTLCFSVRDMIQSTCRNKLMLVLLAFSLIIQFVFVCHLFPFFGSDSLSPLDFLASLFLSAFGGLLIVLLSGWTQKQTNYP